MSERADRRSTASDGRGPRLAVNCVRGVIELKTVGRLFNVERLTIMSLKDGLARCLGDDFITVSDTDQQRYIKDRP